MSKKKKIIIIVSIIVALLIAGLVTWLILRNKDKDSDSDKPTPSQVASITITFDADGGEEVDSMTVKKGSSFQLPETTKEGYTFVGWYNGSKLYTDDDTADITDNLLLTAKWEKAEEDEIVMTITFDAKGGSKVSNMTVKCVDKTATIKNLPKSKRDSYNFLSWEDKNGKSILDGAKLVCDEDNKTLKLYAVWEYDGPTANPEPAPDNTVVKEKTYKCEEGYKLDENTKKCYKTAELIKYCEGNWKLVNGECVNPSSPNPKGTRTCPSKTYGGWTGTGTYYEAGRGYCGYQELTSYIGQSTNCQNNGGTLAANNHCYKHIEINYSITCASDEKKFGDQEIAPGNGGGCYQVKVAKTKCPDGYTNASVYGSCALVKNAIYE